MVRQKIYRDLAQVSVQLGVGGGVLAGIIVVTVHEGVQHHLAVRQAFDGRLGFGLGSVAQDALVAAVGQQHRQAAFLQGHVGVAVPHTVDVGGTQFYAPSRYTALGIGAGGQFFHGGKVINA